MTDDDLDRAISIGLERARRRNAAQAGVTPRTTTDRESIAVFLTAEAQRFDNEARRLYLAGEDPGGERCEVRAALCRTLAAQVQRSDDRKDSAT